MLPSGHTALPVAMLLSSIALAACQGEPPPRSGGTSGRGAAGAVTVVAVPLQTRAYTDEFTALGSARANESIEVTSRVSSVVSRIAFDEGQHVDAGDLLLELDHRELAADVSSAKAALQKVTSQYQRRESLARTRVISAAELDELKADVLGAEAALRAAQARLRDSYIRAPFAGTVGLRRVSPGDLVGPDTVITTLDDVANMKLDFTVPEVFIASLHPGMRIEAETSVYPQRRFSGELKTIDPRIDPVTRSVTVVAVLPNPEGLIRPGMFMTVRLQRRRDDVLLIPEQALVPRRGRQYVFVIEDGKAVEKQVELGVRAPGLAEVREGLDPGEVLITEGTQKLRNGTPVRIASNG